MNKRIAFLLSLCWVVCCSYAQNSFSKHEVRQTMRRVADWQIAHMKEVTAQFENLGELVKNTIFVA